jgi:hypothetical protein
MPPTPLLLEPPGAAPPVVGAQYISNSALFD